MSLGQDPYRDTFGRLEYKMDRMKIDLDITTESIEHLDYKIEKLLSRGPSVRTSLIAVSYGFAIGILLGWLIRGLTL